MAKTAGLLLVAFLVPGAAAAAPAPASNGGAFKSEYKLSQQEIDRILATAAANKPKGLDPERSEAGPGVHGEIGFGIGTGGYRSAFGTGIFPLGGNSGAMITFDIDRWGHNEKR